MKNIPLIGFIIRQTSHSPFSPRLPTFSPIHEKCHRQYRCLRRVKCLAIFVTKRVLNLLSLVTIMMHATHLCKKKKCTLFLILMQTKKYFFTLEFSTFT